VSADVKQFDIVANPFPRSRERQPYLVVLQTDLLLRTLETVVVAPLEIAREGEFAEKLNPKVQVGDQSFALMTQELVAVRKNVLGKAEGSLAHDRDAIIAALDLLFTGF
jgi:toxin CcdB